MEQADLDALIVTSRHNVQYLLGGYRFFFFDAMEAIGDQPIFASICLSTGTSLTTPSTSEIRWRASRKNSAAFR